MIDRRLKKTPAYCYLSLSPKGNSRQDEVSSTEVYFFSQDAKRAHLVELLLPHCLREKELIARVPQSARMTAMERST